MKTFAYIVTPVTIKELKNYRPTIRILPDFIIKPFLKILSSIRVLSIKKIKTLRGKEIEGFLIIVPLIPTLDTNSALEKIISAGQLAERLGAKIIGLDERASQFINNALPYAQKNLKIPLTTGSSLTAWSVVEQIYRIAKIKKMDLRNSKIAVINAASPIGCLCSKKLSDYSNSIIISDKNKNRLEQIKETIFSLNTVEVQIEEDGQTAAKKAGVIINTDNTVLNTAELNSNTVFCSIYTNNNAQDLEKPRSDITFLKAGLVKLPFPERFYSTLGLPRGIISTSMAETMLLTLEEKFVSYSLGDNINVDKLEEIADIAVQHGFEIWAPEAPVI